MMDKSEFQLYQCLLCLTFIFQKWTQRNFDSDISIAIDMDTNVNMIGKHDPCPYLIITIY